MQGCPMLPGHCVVTNNPSLSPHQSTKHRGKGEYLPAASAKQEQRAVATPVYIAFTLSGAQC